MSDMTTTQARVARALAAAHGHEWARVEATDGLLDIEQIRAATSAARTEPEWAGIDAPTLMGDRVIHRTISGRVEWAIGPQGLEEVIITRPVPRRARGLIEAVEARLEDLVPQHWGDSLSIRGRRARSVRIAIAELEQALLPLESAVCIRWADGRVDCPTLTPAYDWHWDALVRVLDTAGMPLPARPYWILPDQPDPEPAVLEDFGEVV